MRKVYWLPVTFLILVKSGEDGDFIQLQDGTNTITYNAESGINYLSVSVYYRISYLGV